MTEFHQIEKSFRNDCVPPNLKMTAFHKSGKSLEMTMFHRIIKWLCSTRLVKRFRNDCVPPNWEKVYKWLCSLEFKNDCVPQEWEKFRNDCVQTNLKMTVFHQIEKLRNDHHRIITVPPNSKRPCSTKFKIDRVPQNWETFRNDCVPPNWKKKV